MKNNFFNIFNYFILIFNLFIEFILKKLFLFLKYVNFNYSKMTPVT